MILLQSNTDLITFQCKKSTFSFLPTGDIFEFNQDGVLINGYQGTMNDGSINNIWLRVYNDDGVHSYPLIGIRSKSKISKGQNSLTYSGTVENVRYEVTFYAAGEGLWFWNVELTGENKLVDVVYGQDIGVAQKGSVLSNELYTAQYLGHSIFQNEHGYLVCSRQNQPQNGNFPFLQQGMLSGKVVGYSTDGMQFFGLSYKAREQPEALSKNLPNQNYQFELSYTALQSEKIVLNGKKSVTFYGLFKDTHQNAVTKPESLNEVATIFAGLPALYQLALCQTPQRNEQFGATFASPEWTERDVASVFPLRKLEERENGTLLSFFTKDHTHVVLQQKEMQVERPHGHIISSKMNMTCIDSNIITSTNYMYGLFNSQTTVGNTSFHKLMSVNKGLLNLQKHSGQRLYVCLEGQYRLLTMPAAYEMGINFARWYYVLANDTLIITSFAAAQTPDIILEVKSTSRRKYDFILTNQLVLGENEFEQAAELEEIGSENIIIRLSPDAETWKKSPYPNLHYDIQFPANNFTFSDDRIFYTDGKPRNGTFLTVSLTKTDSFQCVIQGRLEKQEPCVTSLYSLEKERAQFDKFYSSLTCGFKLEKDGEESVNIEKLNETVLWFSHNAMVHFAVPHGLEQCGGAAWGTRDVCQGPMEYFIAMQHNALARATLLNIFSHQLFETGEWPQWFMFDRYHIHADECHGDVVFWPLKALGDYINATGDDNILNECVPYMDSTDRQSTNQEETLLCHLMRATNSVKNRFLYGTALISYGGGDWDDTLQPIDEKMRENLSSAWTQALAFQVLGQLYDILHSVDPNYAADLKKLSENVKCAFSKYFIKDGVIAGFVCRNSTGSFDVLIHPDDNSTGIHYRLIPLTRSIIAELVSKKQAEDNVELIDRHLNFPDGVRLMDRPAKYDGGVSHLFRRAEQAANIGREISLQYTHAHIRYLEAMAKIGDGDRAFDGLFTVNPIGITETVANAMPRQSNMYFSSSDGMFPDRYIYSRDFDKLKSGSIGVKGGWRLYSSGPGIYLNQLITNILGIRFEHGEIVIDPVLPIRLDGLCFSFTCFDRPVRFVYHIAQKRTGHIRITQNNIAIEGRPLVNLYRKGGLSLSRTSFLKDEGDYHIFLS